MNASLLKDILHHLEKQGEPPFDLEALARDIGYSKYYLCRAFHAATGEGLITYLRRLALARSAEQLRAGRRVMDVAVAYGYQSHEAYHRAFRRMFGITPAAFQRGDTHPSLLLKRAWHGELMPPHTPHTYQVDWPETQLWGMGGEFTYDEFDQIEILWQRFHHHIDDRTDTFGVTIGLPENPHRFQYYAASDQRSESLGLKSLCLPARRYQVFEHRGPVASLMQTFNYIWGVWLPDHQCRVEGIDFERYPAGFDPNDPDGMIEIYIPIDT